MKAIANIRDAHLGWTTAHGGFTCLLGRNFATTLPPHVHASYVLGVVDAGAVRITVNGETHVALPGSVVAIAPFTVHTEIAVGEDGWSFRYLYPTERNVRIALGAPLQGEQALLNFASPVIDNVRLAAMIARVHSAMAVGRDPRANEELLADLFRYLRSIAPTNVGKPTREPRYRRSVNTARAIITNNLLRDVTLKDLADAAGLSPFHFNRVFRDEVGLPPYAYYERVRIAHAHELVTRGYEVRELVHRLGFSDQSHFTRQFKRSSFTTPGHYALLARHAHATSRFHTKSELMEG